MKETGSGYIRQATDINKRKQDGPKFYWLCEACEQRFSLREDYFLQTVFRPYIQDEEASFQYDERLFYFAVSLLWRSLIRTLELPDVSTHRFYELMQDAEQKWRRYLVGESQDAFYKSIQVFLSGVSDNPTVPTKHFNMYLARAIDSTVGSSQSECFMYAKFSRFLFFGYLTKCDQSKWIGTQILPEGGVIGAPQSIEDGVIGDFLVSRPREAFERADRDINAKSKEIISKHFVKHRNRIVGSDQWKAQVKDHFSPVSYPKPVFPKVGRNDPCPCGSGNKFKKCHGG